MKEAVEEAFAAGLVKVVFATETLALGINMPARSVVIEKLTKFTGERHEFLTPGEYTQLTGRAGRRGIDAVGYALVLWSPWVPFEQVAGLASRRTDALRSSFRPTYNMAVNLIRRYTPEAAHHLINLSFAQFRADRDVVALERQLERTREQLRRQREVLGDDVEQVTEYRRLTDALETERRGGGGNQRVARALDALHPGDVIWVGARGGKVVVLSQEARRNATRLLGLTGSRQLVRLGPGDFDAAPVALGKIDLPTPYAPRNRSFQRETMERLRRAKVRRQPRDDGGDPIAGLEAALAAHPLAGTSSRDPRLRAVGAIERLERDEGAARAAGQEPERQPRPTVRPRPARPRVVGLRRRLVIDERWGGAGAALHRDRSAARRVAPRRALRRPLAAGARRRGVVLHVRAAGSRRRGADGTVAVAVERGRHERGARSTRCGASSSPTRTTPDCPRRASPTPGSRRTRSSGRAGTTSPSVLDDDELTGGDFVRHIKQCIDLLRQVGDVAPDPETRRAARDAADACHRGVVAAGGVAAA